MKKYLLLIFVAVGILAGCSKIDLDAIGKQTVGTALAVPIGTLNTSIFDIYQKFDTIIELKCDDDKTVFVYWQQPIKIDEFNLKDFTKGELLTGSYQLIDEPSLKELLKYLPEGVKVPLPEGVINISDTLKYSFKFNESTDSTRYTIDSIGIRNTRLDLAIDLNGIELNENNYLEAEISFPTLRASNPVVIKALATTSHIDIERQVRSFLAPFDKDGNSTIDMYLTFRIVSDGTAEVTRDAGISYATGFDDIDYNAIYGYIYSKPPVTKNRTVIELSNTDQLHDFVEKNYASLYNPELIISLTTNIGIDAKLNVNEIYSHTKTGRVTHAMFGGKTSFTEILKTPQEPGSTITSSITLNREFGQMNKLFEEVPDMLVLDWDVCVGEENPSHNNFIVNPILLDADFAVRVPIWFDKGTFVNFNDTLQADLTGINGEWANYVDMQKFEIFLDFQNTLPVQAYAYVTFLDSLNNPLFERKDIEIACPSVDSLGRSEDIAQNEEVLEFTDDEIALILQTKKIAVTYGVIGHDEEATINFHASDGLTLKVSAYATAAISTTKKNR